MKITSSPSVPWTWNTVPKTNKIVRTGNDIPAKPDFQRLQETEEEQTQATENIQAQQEQGSDDVWIVLAETTVEALAKRWISVEK